MRKIVSIICSAVLLAVAFWGGYFVGRQNQRQITGSTFYAVIEEKKGAYMLVSGLSINDINSRGKFSFTVDDKTTLEWHNTEITLDELQTGDMISVTYTGAVQETEPAGIETVLKIQLLEDEKTTAK